MTTNAEASMWRLAYGWPNAHATGIVLKETVRRAVEEIRRQRLSFDAQGKDTHGRPDDVVTSADIAAQAIYVRAVTECFPGVGLIGEEDSLYRECTIPGHRLFAVFDPLDGTKAFSIRSASGVATQIAIVEYNEDFTDGIVLAAFIGDVTSGDIYGFRPRSSRVHRITNLTRSENLTALVGRKHSGNGLRVVIRNHPERYHPTVQQMLRSPAAGGITDGLCADHGSFTMSAARLWTGEYDVLVEEPFTQTPWDASPIVGIFRQLGYLAFIITDHEASLSLSPAVLRKEVFERDYYRVWIHPRNVDKIAPWVAAVPAGVRG